MEVCITEISNITKYLEEESTYGLMEKPMKGNGKKIKCMVMVYLFGKMVKNMKEISSMIEEKAMVDLCGKMEEYMMAHGRMGNSMEEVNL
jgi:hypothetical protein